MPFCPHHQKGPPVHRGLSECTRQRLARLRGVGGPPHHERLAQAPASAPTLRAVSPRNRSRPTLLPASVLKPSGSGRHTSSVLGRRRLADHHPSCDSPCSSRHTSNHARASHRASHRAHADGVGGMKNLSRDGDANRAVARFSYMLSKMGVQLSS